MGKIKTLDTDRCNGCNNPQYDCMCPIEAAQMERKPLSATEINRREDAKLRAMYPEELPEPNMFARSV